MLKCEICGNNDFVFTKVLWDELISAWQLSPYEVEYIDHQQGQRCQSCGCNLRSIAIAKAIVDAYDFEGTLNEFVQSDSAAKLKVLEINEAGDLSSILKKIPGHQLITYPDYDMMHLSFPDNSWDLVIHSDTLEHVPDPMCALSQCRRILSEKGRCIFTIPIVVDRISRFRTGLSKSYHGIPTADDEDNLVHTEFGMDFWKYVIKAGFQKCTIHTLRYPTAFAIEASG